jgi:hypothetical protein
MIVFDRREDELLVCLVRPALDAARVRQLVQTELDWDYLVAMADRHSLIPWLYFRLNSIGPEAVPAEPLSRLRSRNQENTRQSLSLTGELLNLLELLEAAGIRAVPFKGPTLALAAYGDVALREFGDLDILVHKQEVLKVKELLSAWGFKPTPELSSAQEAALLRFDCACNFGNDKNVLFDVHWNFAASYYSLALDVNSMWERLEQITIAGKQLPTLSAEDLLLVLCLHGFTHHWERLEWVCDVAGLIFRSDINWRQVFDNASRHGCRRILSLGITLASELFEAPVPAGVMQMAQRDGVVTKLAVEVRKQLFAPKPVSAGVLDDALLQLRMRERGRDKLMSGVRLAATPRVYDWTLVTLPRWLFFLYYPLRPLRLAGKYGARLLGGTNQ